MESSPRELATHELKIRFFDLNATIRSDSSAYVSLFGRMYRRFQIDAFPSSVQAPVEFTVLTKPDNRWGKHIMILDGKVWPLSDPRLLEGYTIERDG